MTKFDSAAFVICCYVTVTLKEGVARLIKALAICEIGAGRHLGLVSYTWYVSAACHIVGRTKGAVQ